MPGSRIVISFVCRFTRGARIETMNQILEAQNEAASSCISQCEAALSGARSGFAVEQRLNFRIGRVEVIWDDELTLGEAAGAWSAMACRRDDEGDNAGWIADGDRFAQGQCGEQGIREWDAAVFDGLHGSRWRIGLGFKMAEYESGEKAVFGILVDGTGRSVGNACRSDGHGRVQRVGIFRSFRVGTVPLRHRRA